jgi:hypothetical protein
VKSSGVSNSTSERRKKDGDKPSVQDDSARKQTVMIGASETLDVRLGYEDGHVVRKAALVNECGDVMIARS